MKVPSFPDICRKAPLTICPLLGVGGKGIEPQCYSRNFELGETILFEFAAIVVYLAAIVMGVIMVYHVNMKYTAVGRKEMAIFFYLYMLATVVEMLLVSGVISPAFAVYPWMTAAHIGLISASIWALFLNGFIGFQFIEDSTPLSLWGIRWTSLLVFGVAYFISIGTTQEFFRFLSPTNSFPLWIMYFVLNGAMILIYFLLQIVLVFKTLDVRWPLGDIILAAGFFGIGQAALYFFSDPICVYTNHYIDGVFFGVLCTLLSVMMVYKYWDSITKEDLEFAVSSVNPIWEMKMSHKDLS
ncbi:hypothetical protein K493DRAFT_378423 [Basidiobolus meristosporus CBS 931.73]|uniref:Uncharacterized protein n=1 Tax=Basidiobolus meristosporus CBS 931.73 TaxID=1314790 RepID=A0A1Y1Y1V7_9FUNG|nr:hypothetical protein K493DRAFT_378423 [Basidiobolus meristosporus CBS 931.73]|eukprot:ORX91604.1 hypothetical protein K493DRAFT_378423 [Basidiobolus meristosporus CBS 931.73]